MFKLREFLTLIPSVTLLICSINSDILCERIEISIFSILLSSPPFLFTNS